jgi:hypothetical protein
MCKPLMPFARSVACVLTLAALLAPAARAGQPAGVSIGTVLPPEPANAATAAATKASDAQAGVTKASAIAPQGNLGTSSGSSPSTTTKATARERNGTGR